MNLGQRSGKGLREWGRDDGVRGEGAEGGEKGLGLGIVLRLQCCCNGCKCGWQREMMLNRSLCRQAGSFFLLYSHNGQPRQPGSHTLSRNSEETMAESLSQCHCPRSARARRGKPVRSAAQTRSLLSGRSVSSLIQIPSPCRRFQSVSATSRCKPLCLHPFLDHRGPKQCDAGC